MIWLSPHRQPNRRMPAIAMGLCSRDAVGGNAIRRIARAHPKRSGGFRGKGFFPLRQGRLMAFLCFWILTATPLFCEAGGVSQKEYDDCIVRHASRGPSLQATLILQRACFYKYRFNRENIDAAGVSAEQKKLSKIYTPDVCDCVLEKVPESSPDVPVQLILKRCVESARKAPEPSAQ